jgi:carotenoid cleavage dioxygenase
MLRFPDTPTFTGLNEPQRFEADLLDLEVEGDIPAEIDGAFYRVQPDPQFPPKLGDDIYFGGDGAVSMFRIRNGSVDFKHRYVRTDKWKLERKAGRALFGAYRNPLTDDKSVKKRYRGTANTNVLTHAGKLWALKEDSPPVAMDPITLKTKGYSDFGGKLESETFTAHPKIDPVTGQMIAFGYAAKGLCTPWLSYMEIDADGALTKELFIEAPYYCMVHDFAVTEDYVAFPIIPMVGSWERLEKGLPHFGWDGSKEVYLGVLPRDGEAKDVRWFSAPNCFNAHIVNAWNEGSKIHVDLPVSTGNAMPFFPDITGAPWAPTPPIVSRWSVDMSSNSGTFEQKPIGQIPGELPRVDDRYMTRPYRYAWYASVDPSKPIDIPGGMEGMGLFFINMLAFVDVSTGRQSAYWEAADAVFQEVCFIPKSADAPEGEGWIVSVVNFANDRRSELVFLDAQAIERGPVARARLPFMLRPGVHGSWTDGAKLA